MRRKPNLSRNTRTRFFAALTPDAEAQKQLAAKVSDLKTRYPRFRWERPEHWHITLAFYGSLTQIQQQQLVRQLERVARETPVIPVRGSQVDQFPPTGRPVVIAWTMDRTPLLERVAYVTERCVSDVEDTGGLQIFNFRPHLSIARAHEGELKRFESEPGEFEFTARSLDFYSSTSGLGGTKYQILHRFTLRDDGE